MIIWTKSFTNENHAPLDKKLQRYSLNFVIKEPDMHFKMHNNKVYLRTYIYIYWFDLQYVINVETIQIDFYVWLWMSYKRIIIHITVYTDNIIRHSLFTPAVWMSYKRIIIHITIYTDNQTLTKILMIMFFVLYPSLKSMRLCYLAHNVNKETISRRF